MRTWRLQKGAGRLRQHLCGPSSTMTDNEDVVLLDADTWKQFVALRENMVETLGMICPLDRDRLAVQLSEEGIPSEVGSNSRCPQSDCA